MAPLFGHAGWGGVAETLACLFFCAEVGIVGLALAGAVIRSAVLVGISFVPAVAVVATIALSGTGYAVLAITLLAPLAAASSLHRNQRPDPNPPDDTEVTAVVEIPTRVVESETQPPSAERERSGLAFVQFPVVKLIALCLLLLLLSAFAMLSR